MRAFQAPTLEKEEMGPKFEQLYHIGDQVGEGLHAKVYKCSRKLDTANGEPLAVKITRTDEEEMILMIEKEFQLTKSLSHPHLAKSIALFSDRSCVY